VQNNIQFDIVKRGYDPEQVQDYIKMVTDAYSELYTSYNQLQEYVTQLENEQNFLQQQVGSNPIQASNTTQASNVTQSGASNDLVPQLQDIIAKLESEKKLLEQQNGRMYLKDAERENTEQQLRGRIAQLEGQAVSAGVHNSNVIPSFDNNYSKSLLSEAEKTAAQIIENAKVRAQMESDRIKTNAVSEVVRLLRMMDDVNQTVVEMKKLVNCSELMT